MEVYDESVGTEADVEAVMRKYDRESNQRIWTGTPKIVIGFVMVAFAIYCIIDAVFLTTLPERRLSIFVGMIILIGFLLLQGIRLFRQSVALIISVGSIVLPFVFKPFLTINPLIQQAPRSKDLRACFVTYL